jgi:hypothetical protein
MNTETPEAKATDYIRQLIWLYFWLLLFEGALRKWALPQISNPLLVVRDPVALGIYLLAIRARIFPRNFWIIALGAFCVLNLICTFAQLLQYIPPKTIILVAGYGIHANYFHLPLIFIIARVLRPEDIRKFGWWILLCVIPMTILLVAQFQAAPDALVNRTAGGEGEMMIASMGKVRTAGPFSFVIGVVAYYSLATGYLMWGVLKIGTYKTWLLSGAGIALVIGAAVSGSRSVVAACVVVVASLVLVIVLRPNMISRFGQVLVVGLILGYAVSRTPIFKEGLSVITTRFAEVAQASDQSVTGSVLIRFWSGFSEPFYYLGRAPLLGYGLGIGTNAGAKLLTGHALFLLTEDEWSRVFFESGPVLGIAYVFWRCALAATIAWRCFKSVLRGNLLPLLLFSSAFLPLINGQFGQPTILGFVAFTTGLTLAALNMTEDRVKPGALPTPRSRMLKSGRALSPYAARLHGSGTGPVQGNGLVGR